MEIRKVNLRDVGELQEIGKLTFAETFSSKNSEENMNECLESGFSTEKLRPCLPKPSLKTSLIKILLLNPIKKAPVSRGFSTLLYKCIRAIRLGAKLPKTIRQI